MIDRTKPSLADAPVLLIEIGNTSIGVATWHGSEVKAPVSVAIEDRKALGESVNTHLRDVSKTKTVAAVVASVVPPAMKKVAKLLEETHALPVLVVGDQISLPIDVVVGDAKAIGVDRVCAAAAAYDTLQTACTVIDFGTAVTVDLVNDEGTLLGGAILPGLRTQFRALHDYTSVLPEVEPGVPDLPYGRDTIEAIQTGVVRGLVGAVRAIIEGYATSLNHWPQVIATGGDVAFLAPHCDFLDTTVEHLTLRGLGVAYANHLTIGGA